MAPWTCKSLVQVLERESGLFFFLGFKNAKFCFEERHIPSAHSKKNAYFESIGESKAENSLRHFGGDLAQAWKHVGGGSQCLLHASDSALFQVCQTPPAPAGAAVHRAEVPGAPLLL